MRGRIRAAMAAAAAVVMISCAASAATGPRVGPKGSWDEMQKYEYYIGQLSGALDMCNHFELASRLRELAELTPYGRKGWQSLQAFDDIRGGGCGRYADQAREILADRESLWDYLTEKYDCPDGECAPEGGDESLAAECRREADDHLASLPIQAGDVKSVRMIDRQIGVTLVTSGKDGHEAWVRLNSCSGWLVIELSKGCFPRQTFTRGNCAIKGVSRY